MVTFKEPRYSPPPPMSRILQMLTNTAKSHRIGRFLMSAFHPTVPSGSLFNPQSVS
jgi:hypothetical protein